MADHPHADDVPMAIETVMDSPYHPMPSPRRSAGMTSVIDVPIDVVESAQPKPCKIRSSSNSISPLASVVQKHRDGKQNKSRQDKRTSAITVQQSADDGSGDYRGQRKTADDKSQLRFVGFKV